MRRKNNALPGTLTYLTISHKQKQLLDFYAEMAKIGYATAEGGHVEHAYNDMEIRAFRGDVKTALNSFKIGTLLDYGCGGSDYEAAGFDGPLSAREFFGLKHVYRFEPARGIDERQAADAVICFDVLEHIFIADLPATIRELFKFAKRLLVVNVACYPARALLPNGENAHVTVRQPLWWKGLFDGIASEFPEVSIMLLCSVGWRNAQVYPLWSAGEWLAEPTFVTSK